MRDLKEALERAGLEVIEIEGWRTRGVFKNFNPRVAVNHHTAGPERGFAPSLGTVINGRGGASPVPGPLCNVHGPREESLRVHLVAAGKSNNAGTGSFRGVSGNLHTLGLEEEHCGYAREPISELRKDRMVRVMAAFCWAMGVDASWVCQHYEWTSRKIDFVKALLDPDDFRRRVQRRLDIMNGATAPSPPPETGGWLMALTDKQQTDLYNAVMDIRKSVLIDIAQGADDATEMGTVRSAWAWAKAAATFDKSPADVARIRDLADRYMNPKKK